MAALFVLLGGCYFDVGDGVCFCLGRARENYEMLVSARQDESNYKFDQFLEVRLYLKMVT